MKKILIAALLFSGVSCVALADYTKGLAAFQRADYALAVQELSDASDMNDAKAQYLLGFMYYHGYGVPQNYKKAFSLFERSMELGNIDSQTFLAYMYDEGKGVATNKRKAFELYQSSAEQGDVTATMNLGVLFYRGDGVPQNYDKAFELMSSIENAQHPIVQFYLGNLL